MQLDWSKIDTVLLDMDGTLLDLHYDNYFWRQHLPKVIAKKQNIPLAQAWAALEQLFLQHEGTLNWYCVNFWSDELDVDIMQHKREVADKIAYRPTAQAFLQFAQQQVNDMRLVTNAHRKVLNLKIEHTKLDQYFNQMVCSHELNQPKEIVDFWDNLKQDKAFNPDKTLFIDDSESVLDAAKQYGLKHVYSISKPDSMNERTSPSKHPMLESLIDL